MSRQSTASRRNWLSYTLPPSVSGGSRQLASIHVDQGQRRHERKGTVRFFSPNRGGKASAPHRATDLVSPRRLVADRHSLSCRLGVQCHDHRLAARTLDYQPAAVRRDAAAPELSVPTGRW